MASTTYWHCPQQADPLTSSKEPRLQRVATSSVTCGTPASGSGRRMRQAHRLPLSTCRPYRRPVRAGLAVSRGQTYTPPTTGSNQTTLPAFRGRVVSTKKCRAPRAVADIETGSRTDRSHKNVPARGLSGGVCRVTAAKGFAAPEGKDFGRASAAHAARDTTARPSCACSRSTRTAHGCARHSVRRSLEAVLPRGHPVAYRSDLPEEDLGRTLAYPNSCREAGGLSARGERGGHEHAIVMSGALRHGGSLSISMPDYSPQLPLDVGLGQWTFEAFSGTRGSGIDPSLGPR